MKKVAIIGAGPAGLTAALELLKSGLDFEVHIYEKEEVVGGLAKTYEFERNSIDIGGHRYFSKSAVVNRIWKEVLASANSRFSVVNRNSHIYYNQQFVEYPIRLSGELLRAIGVYDSLATLVSYFHGRIKKRKENTLEDYYINHFGKKLYEIFFEIYSLKLWGIHPSNLYAEWGAQRVRKISVSEVVKSALIYNHKKPKEKSFIRQFLYPQFGSGYIWETMSRMVCEMGAKIYLRTSVSNVVRQDNGRFTIILNQKNTVKEFDILISTMPLRELLQNYSDVPPGIVRIANGLQYRDMVIAAICIPDICVGELFLKASKDNWIYVQDRAIPFGRIQILNNWSQKACANKGTVLMELEFYCTKGDDIWNMTDESIVKSAKEGLIKMHMLHEAAQISGSFVKRIEKAYPIYYGTYSKMGEVKNWVNKIPNLYCIGRNGQHKYNNMDHSMLTAIEATKNILEIEKEKETIWDVNSDREYHEKA